MPTLAEKYRWMVILLNKASKCGRKDKLWWMSHRASGTATSDGSWCRPKFWNLKEKLACDSPLWNQALRLQFIPRIHLKSQTWLHGSLTPTLGPEIGGFRELPGESIWSFWINERPCLKGNTAGIDRWRHLMSGPGLCMYPHGFVHYTVILLWVENCHSSDFPKVWLAPSLAGMVCSALCLAGSIVSHVSHGGTDLSSMP